MEEAKAELETEVKHGRRRHGVDTVGDDAVPRGGVASGWGDAPSQGSGAAVGGGGAAAAAVEEPAVTVIRDGNEEVEAAERLAATVADAPRNIGRRVAILKELESEGHGGGGAGALNVAASRAEGIDLSLLTISLYPVEALQEADEVVNWELQLQKITQELRQESDRREGGGEGEGTGGAPQEATTRTSPARA